MIQKSNVPLPLLVDDDEARLLLLDSLDMDGARGGEPAAAKDSPANAVSRTHLSP